MPKYLNVTSDSVTRQYTIVVDARVPLEEIDNSLAAEFGYETTIESVSTTTESILPFQIDSRIAEIRDLGGSVVILGFDPANALNRLLSVTLARRIANPEPKNIFVRRELANRLEEMTMRGRRIVAQQQSDSDFYGRFAQPI